MTKHTPTPTPRPPPSPARRLVAGPRRRAHPRRPPPPWRRHVDNPPELKSEKTKHNRNVMKQMQNLFKEGGKVIWCARRRAWGVRGERVRRGGGGWGRSSGAHVAHTCAGDGGQAAPPAVDTPSCRRSVGAPHALRTRGCERSAERAASCVPWCGVAPGGACPPPRTPAHALIWQPPPHRVAPSGGRDRKDESGDFTVAPFDGKSVEMFRLCAARIGMGMGRMHVCRAILLVQCMLGLRHVARRSSVPHGARHAPCRTCPTCPTPPAARRPPHAQDGG